MDAKPGCPMFLFQDNDMVPIEIRFEETELREKVRKMKAKWNYKHLHQTNDRWAVRLLQSTSSLFIRKK